MFHDPTAGTARTRFLAKTGAANIALFLFSMALSATDLARHLPRVMWSKAHSPTPPRDITAAAILSFFSGGRRLSTRSARSASVLLLKDQVATRESGRLERV